MHLVSEHFLYKQHFDLPMSHFQTLIRWLHARKYNSTTKNRWNTKEYKKYNSVTNRNKKQWLS